MIPAKLGRYEIVDELGKGAMGVVYLARDPLIGRMVALKTFRLGHDLKDEERALFRQRFMREAQSAGILSHASIVTIHDVVEESEEGVTFIAMEYIRGTTLKELMRRDEPLDLEFTADVMQQIAEALDYAHSKGVIHRDVKPANIIITPDGKVKITDFGIARMDTSNLTQEGQLLGTPNYMAPEQIQGAEVDKRADLFSFGVLLYEMLTRRKPFQGDNVTMVTYRIVHSPFTPLAEYVDGLPLGVEGVLKRALAKDPRERYQTAVHLARDYRQAIREGLDSGREPVALTPPPELPEVASPVELKIVDEAATVDVAEPILGGAVPAAARPWGRRIGGAVVVGVVISTLMAGLGSLWLKANQPEVTRPGSERRLQMRVLPLLVGARRQLQLGHPGPAIRLYDEALRMAGEDDRILRARQEAQVLLQASMDEAITRQRVARLLEEGRLALAARRFEKAMKVAAVVLELQPANEEAAEVKMRAGEALASGRVRPRGPDRGSSGSQVAASPQPSVQPAAATAAPEHEPPAEQAAEGTLQIDFLTQKSQGVLTIYAGERQILREPFRFVEKVGLFRSEPRAGRIEAVRVLPRGEVVLRVYVLLRGSPVEMVTAQGEIPGGGSRALKIHVSPEGEVSARLE